MKNFLEDEEGTKMLETGSSHVVPNRTSETNKGLSDDHGGSLTAMLTEVNMEQIERAVTMILEAVGEDPSREGLRDTPKRVAKMYGEVFAGLWMKPEEVLSARFHIDHDEMVFVKDISFYSMCEHHLLPFFGKAHVAYLPRHGVVTGLSKLARLVEAVARRPQVQERMTNEIADVLERELNTQGVMVVVEAEHLCMNMRGIQKPGSQTVTLASRGRYANDVAKRDEIFRFIRNGT